MVTRQKNDPCGLGMECWIPALPSLGELCPTTLLRRWLTRWDAMYNTCSGPLFCVTSASHLKAISYDSWRKTCSNFFNLGVHGTHSFRKGGAHWYKIECSADPDAVQAQGGWMSKATMDKLYACKTALELRTSLLRSAQPTAAAASGTTPKRRRITTKSPCPASQKMFCVHSATLSYMGSRGRFKLHTA